MVNRLFTKHTLHFFLILSRHINIEYHNSFISLQIWPNRIEQICRTCPMINQFLLLCVIAHGFLRTEDIQHNKYGLITEIASVH